MANNNFITYIQPNEKYVKVSNSIVDRYSLEVIGLYSKIIRLSAGKSLNIAFISKKIKVNDRKLRKIIVFLEDEGYIVREPLKNERGSFCGWNYHVYAEPVPKDKRSHAGKKVEIEDSGLTQNRTSPLADKVENGKDNIIIDSTISNNIDEDLSINKNKKSTDVDKKVPDAIAPTDEELTFISKMKERFPHIMKMEQPLTLQQAKKLKGKYDSELLSKIMEEIENWKPLIKNKVSAYMTINKWCQKEIERI